MGEAKRLGFYANGEHIVSKTEKYMDAYNPSTGEVIAKVPCCTEEEVEYAIACAKQAYPGWSSTPVIKRVQILYKLRDLLVEHMRPRETCSRPRRPRSRRFPLRP